MIYCSTNPKLKGVHFVSYKLPYTYLRLFPHWVTGTDGKFPLTEILTGIPDHTCQMWTLSMRSTKASSLNSDNIPQGIWAVNCVCVCVCSAQCSVINSNDPDLWQQNTVCNVNCGEKTSKLWALAYTETFDSL